MSKKKQKSIEELLEEALVPEEEQPYPVPENWVWVKLNSIFEQGKEQVQPTGTENYIGLEHLLKGGGIAEVGNTEGLKSKKVVFIKGDVLYGKLRPYLNKHAYVDFEGVASTDIIVFRSNCLVLNKLLDMFLGLPYVVQYAIENSNGINLPRVSPKIMEKLPFPLPPLNEQKRISEKVERLFAKIDEAKRLIEKVKESFEIRRVAILDKAFKGQLGTNDPNEMSMLETTNEIKEKDLIPKEEQPYEVPENWVWTRLGNLVHFIGGGTPSKTVKKYWDGNIPWATVKDIKGKYLLQTKDSITEEGLNNSSASLAAEEELIVVTRMSPGKAIISKIKTAINQDLKIVKPKTKIHSGFLWIFFEVNRPLIESLSTGSTVKGIQIKKLDELLISLPPYEEQKRIADKVDNLLSKLENEQELVLEVEEKLNLLKQSILNKAFRGELGTNDPNDEHAIELLKEVLKSKSK